MKGRSLEWIPEHARRLAARRAVRGRSWSLAQVCEHLALAMRATAEMPGPGPGEMDWWRSLGPLARAKRTAMKHGLLWTGRFPEGVPSPEVVVPSASPDLEAAIAGLARAAEAVERKCADRGASWVRHPVLGPMSGAQWRRFHALHARHHFKFVREPAATVAADGAGGTQSRVQRQPEK